MLTYGVSGKKLDSGVGFGSIQKNTNSEQHLILWYSLNLRFVYSPDRRNWAF